MLADVFLLDGTHVNYVLVKGGWWWYRKYAPRESGLEKLEKERETPGMTGGFIIRRVVRKYK